MEAWPKWSKPEEAAAATEVPVQQIAPLLEQAALETLEVGSDSDVEAISDLVILDG